MQAYIVSDYLHVCVMTPQTAERHTRRVHNVPPDCGLGWKPYTVIITNRGVTAHSAYHSLHDMQRRMSGYRLVLNPSRGRESSDYVIRTGRLVEASHA